MNRKKWLSALAIFILVQDAAIPHSLFSAVNHPLTQIKVCENSVDRSFKKIYDSVCMGLAIYKLDVTGRSSKESLIDTLGKIVSPPGIRFDLKNADVLKKGWTRYYPFSIDGKNFIMRIFLTAERPYQPPVAVLYEGNIVNPAVTFQVLPSLNEILAECKIAPRRTYSTRQLDSSS